MIPFNKPYITGKEVHYIYDAVSTGHISGNGKYTKLCQSYFEDKLSIKKTLLTTSCTDALEMSALLLDIKPGDEVIVPSYTFVSTALAFVRQGAKIVFADSHSDHPGIDERSIEALITPKTKAIVPVHYAGVACNMDVIMDIAAKYSIFVVEDAAQAIDSFYTGKDGVKKSLGSIGHLSAFSFHETKNIQCGEGGFLGINDDRFVARAEVIWEKGTNRAEFFRGEINKYGWVDIGSSFLPSEITAAFLWAQLEALEDIQNIRKAIWQIYKAKLQSLQDKGQLKLPLIPEFATNNGHMFYMLCKDLEERTALIKHLKKNGVSAVFHYLALNKSQYYLENHQNFTLPNTDRYEETLLRLPLFCDLSKTNVKLICELIINFYRN